MKVELNLENSEYKEINNIDEAEALVTTYPCSSKAWIHYMVYVLRQGEVTKARSVAKRGLQSLHFRDDNEKLNLWKALLNLENHYGTHDSLDKVFKEALVYNDQEKIYNHMVDAYISLGKKDEVEKLQQTMLKKFKYDKNVWIKFVTYYIQSGNQREARDLVIRSLQSLPPKEHADVLGKAAHLEYKYGDVERSLGMYEDILVKYPKRKDLRSCYIHILKELGQHDRAETLSDLTYYKNNVYL